MKPIKGIAILTTDKILWEEMEWVLRAKSKERLGRYPLDCILIKSKLLIATDGHRLHISKFGHTIPPGVYEVIRATSPRQILLVETDRQYVEINKAFPKKKTIRKIEVSVGSKGMYLEAVFAKVIRALNESITVDRDFFEDVVRGNMVWKLRLRKEEEGSNPVVMPLTLSAKESYRYRFAVIMPVRVM